MFNYEKLIAVLDQPPMIIGLAGAGGKTSTMFALGKHYANLGFRVVLTTTTKILKPTFEQMDRLEVGLSAKPINISQGEILALGAAIGEDGKLVGFDPSTLDAWDASAYDVLIYEADGAKCKAIKAPREDEPRIATSTTHVIGCIGLDVVGKIFDEKTVHRIKEFEKITGCLVGEKLNVEHMKTLVIHQNGLFQNTSESMKKICLLTKADDHERIEEAKSIMLRLNHWQGTVLWI